MEGDCKVIKMILDAAKRHNDNDNDNVNVNDNDHDNDKDNDNDNDNEIEEGVNLALVKKVLKEGDCKVIKMILDAAKRHNDNYNDNDNDIDKEGLLAVMKQLPYKRAGKLTKSKRS